MSESDAQELLATVAIIERMATRVLDLLRVQGVTLDPERRQHVASLLRAMREEASEHNGQLQLLVLAQHHRDEGVRVDIERRMAERRIEERRQTTASISKAPR
jgi:hypothetical protein